MKEGRGSVFHFEVDFLIKKNFFPFQETLFFTSHRQRFANSFCSSNSADKKTDEFFEIRGRRFENLRKRKIGGGKIFRKWKRKRKFVKNSSEKRDLELKLKIFSKKFIPF